jgi:acyl-CoA thioesterase I
MPCQKIEFKSRLFVSLWLSLALFASAACQPAGQAEVSKRANLSTPAATPSASVKDSAKDKDTRPVIVAFGDSLTAGYGLPESQSYTALLQRKLDEQGYAYRVINAGVSGDTSAGGLRRLDWSLSGDVKFLILELGGNDGLRGLPVVEMKKNLAQIIEAAQQRNIQVVLAGMEAPPNLGATYATQFRQAFRELANQYQLPFIPFVLDGVGGRVEFNQADGIHPNAAGEKIMTENVWRVLEPLLAAQK